MASGVEGFCGGKVPWRLEQRGIRQDKVLPAEFQIPTPEHVRATTAIDLVVTEATCHNVKTRATTDEVVAQLAKEIVVAGQSEDSVVTDTGIHRVRADIAVNQVGVANRAVQCLAISVQRVDVLGHATALGRHTGVKRVAALATNQAIASPAWRTADRNEARVHATEQQVVALAATKGVVALVAPQPVGTSSRPVLEVAPQGIEADSTIQEVIAQAADEDIAAVVAIELIVAFTAVDLVDVQTAFEEVLSFLAVETVTARCARKTIIATTAAQGVVALLSIENVVAVATLQYILTAATGELVVIGLTVQGVVTIAASQRVATGAAAQPVGLRTAGEPIVAVTAIEKGHAATSGQRIVACAAVELDAQAKPGSHADLVIARSAIGLDARDARVFLLDAEGLDDHAVRGTSLGNAERLVAVGGVAVLPKVGAGPDVQIQLPRARVELGENRDVARASDVETEQGHELRDACLVERNETEPGVETDLDVSAEIQAHGTPGVKDELRAKFKALLEVADTDLVVGGVVV